MRRLIFVGIVAAFLVPAMAPADGMRSIEDRTDISWCRYVPYVGWKCGWHD